MIQFVQPFNLYSCHIFYNNCRVVYACVLLCLHAYTCNHKHVTGDYCNSCVYIKPDAAQPIK